MNAAASTTRRVRQRSSSTPPTSNRSNSVSTRSSSTPPARRRRNATEDRNSNRTKKTGKSIIQEQKENILKTAYYNRAYKLVQEHGILWDTPPSMIVKPYPLKDCWKRFFKLRVFNWIPEAMLPGWRPKCPHCNIDLTKNGRGLEARLVFDQCDNYLLNSPNRYYCKECQKFNERCSDDSQKREYTYISTCDEIMNQIKDVNPQLLDLFPCHLSSKNAIDKKLMDLIIHCAVKGIGPSAMAENISSWHELAWQKLENAWARYVIKWLEQPSANQLPLIRRDQIQKCPEYFSRELGGCIPSGDWLVNMFCSVLLSMRPYLDSEVIKRLRLSILIAIDASYKVPKWMMTWGGVFRIYNALHSGTNECLEIIMQRFSTSDNHDELGSNLAQLAELGLDPKIAFSDDPARDESLLKQYFEDLRNGLFDINDEDDVQPQNMPLFETPKRVLYMYKKDDVLDSLRQFRQDVEDAINNTSQTSVKVAFDTGKTTYYYLFYVSTYWSPSHIIISLYIEWPIYFEGGPNNRKKVPGKINIVQLGSNVVDYTIIIELYNFTDNEAHLAAIGQKLASIFNLKVTCFTGHSQSSDYTKLQKQYPIFDLPESARRRFEDIKDVALDRGVTSRGKGKTTLQALCKGQNMFLKKQDHIRVGTCFASKNGLLPSEAQKYCQYDVESVLVLHQLYSELPDMTKRIKKITRALVGRSVDIMPASGRAIHPLAQGEITQVGGVWQPNGHKLRSNQVLVKVKKVFKPKGIIHYPCTDTHLRVCSCRRLSHGPIQNDCNFYLLSQMGKPPFTMMECNTRLRLSNDMFTYEPCIYTQGQTSTTDTPLPTLATNYTLGNNQQNLVRNGQHLAVDVGNANDETDVIEEDDVDEASVALNPEVIALLDGDGDVDESAVPQGNEEASTPSDSEVRMATCCDFDEELERLIKEADELAKSQEQQSNNDGNTNRSNLPLKKVLGDAFHFMDRAKIPMHHEYKALFFRCLRSAMFIMNKDDVDEVKKVLEQKEGTSWNKKMAFDFEYIAQRVRRTVPPPAVLYNRMKVVFDFFKDKIDSTTRHTLFNDRNRNKFEGVLDLVKKGYASDPPGMSLYVEKTDTFGRLMKDKDGLTLYRSLRGTCNLESLHQYLTTSFGHTISGPFYSDCLLSIVRHHINWRMSRKNRPNFPPISHYDGMLLDHINSMYEIIYGECKYKDWEPFNEHLPETVSPFGIVAVNKQLTESLVVSEEDKTIISKSKMLKYLADRQGVPVPFLPIRGEAEKRLIHRKLNEALSKGESLSNQTVFENLASRWNAENVCVRNKIYPKLPCHFAKYVKSWKKNQDKRAAAVTSGADRLAEVLEHVSPQAQNNEAFEIMPLDNRNIQNDSTDSNPANSTRATENAAIVEPLSAMEALCQAVEMQPPAQVNELNQQKKPKGKTCIQKIGKRKCPYPLTCPGRVTNANCWLYTNGDPSKKIKRTIVNKHVGPKRCTVCGVVGCDGAKRKKNCPQNRNRNNNA